MRPLRKQLQCKGTSSWEMNPQHTPSHRTHRRKTSDHSVPQISFASSVFTLFVNKLSSRWGILTLFVLLYVAWSFFAGDTPAVSTTLSTINPEKRDDPTHRRPPIFPTELLNNPLTHYAHQRHKSHSHSLPINDVDLRYCGASSCRFLFPIFIGEQESKAQLHFQQLTLLAATLNRTIVLPNAFKGLLASCSRLPFDHYFSTSTLDTLAAHGIRYITQSDLETWALERGEEIPAQFAFVELEPKSKPAGWKPPPIPNKKKLDKRFCLNAFPLDYQPYPVIQHFVAYGYERSRAEVALTRDAIVTALRDSAEAHGQRPGMTKDKKKETAPILLVHYQLRSPFMDVPVPGPPLEYNPKWHETTAAVVDRLRPFVAVHWREYFSSRGQL
ncbi:hypothetical protein BC938DRAFT_478973 [Jimgerdemannia flammicorona]|uniref:Uncharacterized protein n=1 Tax=Jimgerdemannia flammicorona TaxID=994334 RepID=A0A433QLY5_9FUNG|nr:hypothetical protein BC938DRAFT_478973 [Jimgerdemannia flammicorona]